MFVLYGMMYSIFIILIQRNKEQFLSRFFIVFFYE